MNARWMRLALVLLAGLSAFACAVSPQAATTAAAQTASIGNYGDTTLVKPAIVTKPDPSGNLVVNQLVGAERFYDAGYYGSNAVAANVEAGLVWNQHDMLTKVQTYYTSLPSQVGQYDWHATAVGGVIAGLGPQNADGTYYWHQFGIAPGADLVSGAIATSFNSDGSFEITPQSMVQTYNHFFSQTWQEPIAGFPGAAWVRGPADVINSSWGGTDPTGTAYETVALDGLARANPQTTFVVAAGNEGPSGNSVGGPASGYNRISVGALGNDSNPKDFTTVAGFSSRGPQDYADPLRTVAAASSQRVAVDIVAPGQWMVVPAYTGTTGSNTGGTDPYPGATNLYYTSAAGTSFSTPIVSGGVALLCDASYARFGTWTAPRDSRVIRAVLLNSAAKLPGWDNGQHQEGNVTITRQSLDYAQGAGALDLNRAFDQYLSGTLGPGGTTGSVLSVSRLGWDLGSLLYNSKTPARSDYKVSEMLEGGSLMDVTLSWFRDRTTNATTLDLTDDAFANLDLQIWNADFTTLLASSESLYNNVEHLHYALPEDGYYGIRVVWTSEMFDTTGTHTAESYGLAWSAVAVPEPGTLALLASGGAVILLCLIRRRRN